MKNIANCVFTDFRVGRFQRTIGQCSKMLKQATVSTVRLYKSRRIALISRLYGKDSLKQDNILLEIDGFLEYVKFSAK